MNDDVKHTNKYTHTHTLFTQTLFTHAYTHTQDKISYYGRSFHDFHIPY